MTPPPSPYRKTLRDRYRKVYVKIWGDEKFRRLSAAMPNAQTLFLYLLTGPHTRSLPGVFHIGEAALAEGLGWTVKAFREAFREVFAEGMARADWDAKVVFLPRAVQHNRPESPNVVRAWRLAFDDIPECDLKREAFQHVKAFLEGLHQAFADAFGEDLPDALALSGAGAGAGAVRTRSLGRTRKKVSTPSRNGIPDDAFIAGLSNLYPGTHVANELLKLDAWLLANPGRRRKTRRFIIGWLNRCEPPLPPESANGHLPESRPVRPDGFPVEPNLGADWFNKGCGWRTGCVRNEFWEAFAAEWRGAAREIDQCPAHRGPV